MLFSVIKFFLWLLFLILKLQTHTDHVQRNPKNQYLQKTTNFSEYKFCWNPSACQMQIFEIEVKTIRVLYYISALVLMYEHLRLTRDALEASPTAFFFPSSVIDYNMY